MPRFSRKEMAKRSSAPSLSSRRVQQFMEGVRDRRHRQQDQRNHRSLDAQGDEDGPISRGPYTSDGTVEQANLQHLIVMIRSQEDDALGKFFDAALSTVRRFSGKNISTLQTLLLLEVQKIQMEELKGQ